jgi:hypothetical protein
MKLKAVVDSLDGVDEKYRDCYVAFQDGDDEKFRLDVEGLQSHPDALALKNALERQKGRVRELNTELTTVKATIEDLPEDFDIDLYNRAVTEGVGGGGKIKNEDEVRREAADAATAKADLKWKKDNDKLVVERDRLKARVENTEKRSVLDAALDEAKVTDPAYRKAARALLLADMVVHYDGDNIEVLAKDPDMGDIPVAEHVKSWAATDEGKAFIGARDSAGGGANGNPRDGNPPTSDTNPWKTATQNFTEQARLRREEPARADKLMREAGVAVR